MGDIIEKLGISKAPWEMRQGFVGTNLKSFVTCDHKIYDGMHIHNGKNEDEERSNAQLIAVAPEMLEALINQWVFIEDFLACEATSIDSYTYRDFIVKQNGITAIIQKATNKSWEEIKELING